MRQFVEMRREALVASDYTAGCPVLAASLGSGVDEQRLASPAAEIFTRRREASKQAHLRPFTRQPTDQSEEPEKAA